ncbi:MAG TPA: hypothetical protein VKB30_03080, partial [Candidatus Limnocylindrales bacterium]|nr:hypothetical protein [Candidatus Limnocylindrales bacterium]
MPRPVDSREAASDHVPGDLHVPVAPLPSRRPSRGRPAPIAGLVALVAIVAGAVWLAQAFPAGRDEATIRAPTP